MFKIYFVDYYAQYYMAQFHVFQQICSLNGKWHKQ